jgi:hypothetical protein
MAIGVFAETLEIFISLCGVFLKAEVTHLSIRFDQNPLIWSGHTST